MKFFSSVEPKRAAAGVTILMVAPFPPPINGQAVASEALRDRLAERHSVLAVNTSKKRRTNFRTRVREVLGLLRTIRRARHSADVVYISLSESVLGNLRDLGTYLLCFRKLPQTTVHLHGGANMRQLLSHRRPVTRALNRFFLRRVKAVVVLGSSFTGIFEGVVPTERIFSLANFSDPALLTSRASVEAKFRVIEPLHVLFLSNLVSGKGHRELVAAFLSLPAKIQQRLSVTFAGDISTAAEERWLEDALRLSKQLIYAGVVSGEGKKALLHRAHVFCLPTYYRYEGQPISILEAYASGCFVVTTNHSGIPDIFTPGENGSLVEARSVASLAAVLTLLVSEGRTMAAVAVRNHETAARRYSRETHLDSLERIVLAPPRSQLVLRPNVNTE